jgi:excisionase family DNA binding protein
LSIDQAAEQLGITRREIYRRIGLGEIEAVWLGRRRLVPLDEIDNFIKRLRAASAVRRSEVA